MEVDFWALLGHTAKGNMSVFLGAFSSYEVGEEYLAGFIQVPSRAGGLYAYTLVHGFIDEPDYPGDLYSYDAKGVLQDAFTYEEREDGSQALKSKR